MKHIFIINPTAGQNNGSKIINNIHNVAKKINIDYELILTKYKGHAKEIASSYHQNDNVCIYACGGDGTLFEIIQGLNSEVPVGLIPCGSGNDFFRSLHIKYQNIEDYIMQLINGKYVYIDSGQATNNKFINSTSCGLDAKVVEKGCEYIHGGKTPRNIAYFKAALKCILHPEEMSLEITIDNQQIHEDCLLVSIMNGQYYGGGFNPTPNGSLQDNYLDVIIIKKLSRLKMYALLPKYLKGKHTGYKECQLYKCKSIKISAKKQIIFETDGECYYTNEEEINILPNSIKLIIPNNHPFN